MKPWEPGNSVLAKQAFLWKNIWALLTFKWYKAVHFVSQATNKLDSTSWFKKKMWLFFMEGMNLRHICIRDLYIRGMPSGAVVKNPPSNTGDTRDAIVIPESGRSPGGGNGNPFQHSCWKMPWTEEPGRLQSMAHTHTLGTTFLSPESEPGCVKWKQTQKIRLRSQP